MNTKMKLNKFVAIMNFEFDNKEFKWIPVVPLNKNFVIVIFQHLMKLKMTWNTFEAILVLAVG